MSKNQQYQDLNKFLDSCSAAREVILSFSNPIVVHHYDCDGIASGAIVSAFFDEIEIKHECLCIRKLDNRTFDMIKAKANNQNREIVFTDIGSSCERLAELEKVVVIDHHQLFGKNFGKATIVNAMEHGFDGGIEVSAATTAYMVCKTKIQVGLVGAVGDMQYPFKSINKLILEEGKIKGIVNEARNIILYGKGSRNLIELLCYSTEPYLPFLSGDYNMCKKFVEENNLPADATYYSLSDSQKKVFINALIRFLSNRNCISIAKNIIGQVYTFSCYEKSSPLYDALECLR